MKLLLEETNLNINGSIASYSPLICNTNCVLNVRRIFVITLNDIKLPLLLYIVLEMQIMGYKLKCYDSISCYMMRIYLSLLIVLILYFYQLTLS